MIAIAPSHRNQLSNYTAWLTKRNYAYKILKSGESSIIYDALILCGGPDIGQNLTRDQNEEKWFKEAYGKIPILGICRGLQISNIILGGSLHDDLSEEKIKHTSNKKEISGEPAPLLESSWHNVIFNDGKKIKVNSRHHQGIKDLAPGLKPLAVCAEDKLLEAVTGEKSLFVQWHPERDDVWGSDAEILVYEWLAAHVKPSDPLDSIFSYLRLKNFTVVSFERIRKSINENYSDEFLNSLILSNNKKVKKVKDRNNRNAIKML